MNRNGERPESLKNDDVPAAPEFVSAVGDDSITRFDEARKRKKKKKSRGGKAAEASSDSAPAAASENNGGEKRNKGGRNGNRNRRHDRPKKTEGSQK